MPQGNKKSRTFRRVYKRTPGARTTLCYSKRKPKRARCAHTGKQLSGVPRNIPSKVAKLPRSKRRPERPYGGNLCSSAMRQKLKGLARSIFK